MSDLVYYFLSSNGVVCIVGLIYGLYKEILANPNDPSIQESLTAPYDDSDFV